MAKPTHTLFHVIEGKDGKDNFWLKIGAGWEHKEATASASTSRFSRPKPEGHTPEDEGRRRLRRRAPAGGRGPSPLMHRPSRSGLLQADAYAGWL